MTSMVALRRVAALAAAILACSLSGHDARADGAAVLPPQAKKWAPWIEYGGYLGTDDASRGEAAFWTPLLQTPSALMFLEMRGKLFEESAEEGNFALGYRKMLPSGWNLGVWGGYDLRGTAFGSRFDQLSGGLELLSPRFDIRANGYLPLDEEETLWSASTAIGTGAPAIQLNGSQILMVTPGIVTTTTAKEFALSGFDGEVGMRLFGGDAARGPELRAYAGGFWFEHDDLAQEIAGPRARLELRFDDIIEAVAGSRLTLEAEFSHDEVRDDKWEIGARLRIPFGSAATRVAALTPQERRMTDALERDTDIVAQTAATSASVFSSTAIEENVIDNLTSVTLKQVTYVNTGDSLDAASAAAGANSLVIVRGDPAAGDVTIQGAQTVLGSGAAINLRGAVSGAVVAFTDPGVRPDQDVGTDSLAIGGDNVHLAGLGIRGGALYTVRMSARTNVVLDQLDIDGGGGSDDGIRIGQGSTVRILNSFIDNTTDDGIAIHDANNDVTISGSTIQNVKFGVYMPENNNSLTVDNLNIVNTGDTSVYITGDFNKLTFTDLVINSAGLEAMFFDSNNTITLTRVSIAQPAFSGIVLDHDITLVINDSTFAGAFGDSGLSIQQPNTISGSGNTAAGATFVGGICEDSGAVWTGAFEFDGATHTAGTCP